MSNPRHSSITPGKPWKDTKGNRIQAHGASLFHENGTFYWYGENKERTKPGSGIWHWGIRCYSSTDLYNWEDRGLIIPPQPDDPKSPLHPAQNVDRPHILHDRESGKYVCWLKIMGQGHTQTMTILVADSLLGPYEIVRTGFRPLGMNAGDFDLVIHPDDGKPYFLFERVHSELICADLTADLQDVTGYYSTHFHRGHPPYVREAPAHFSRAGNHYLFTSGTTGYFPNQSEVAAAESMHGPWTVLGNPHPDDKTNTSYRSQISSVFKHPDKESLYIALADRWLPEAPAELAGDAYEAFRRIFSGEKFEPQIDPAWMDPNTSIADYVWLPVLWDGDRPYLQWMDDWSVDDFD